MQFSSFYQCNRPTGEATASALRSRDMFSRLWSVLIGSVVAALSLCACQPTRPPGAFTFYGGVTRAGNYESAGDFTFTSLIRDLPKPVDSTGKPIPQASVGANMPPVPISFISCYLTLLDGSVGRYSSGSLDWTAPFDTIVAAPHTPPRRALAASAPCADANDNFYVLANDGAAYSFSPDGARRWKKPLFTPSALSLYCDLLPLSDGVVIGFSEDGVGGTIVKLNFDGAVLWRKDFVFAPLRGFAADPQNERIVAALTANIAGVSDTLVCFSSATGARRWSAPLETTRALRMPVLDAAQELILISGISERNGAREDALFGVDFSGKERFRKKLPFTPQGIAIGSKADKSEPLIVLAGYPTGLGAPISTVMGLKADGAEIWRLTFELAVVGAPLIGKNNIAFVGSKGAAVGVYFMDKNGEFQRVVSLSDEPNLCLLPAVDAENNLVFAVGESLGVIKVGKMPIQRLLPY
jgi:outer membrane protein assembly factor BamB